MAAHCLRTLAVSPDIELLIEESGGLEALDEALLGPPGQGGMLGGPGGGGPLGGPGGDEGGDEDDPSDRLGNR